MSPPKAASLILPHLLPSSSIQLGRLLTNLTDPTEDYIQPDYPVPSQPPSCSSSSHSFPVPPSAYNDGESNGISNAAARTTTQSLSNFTTLLQSSQSSHLAAFFTQLLRGSRSSSHSTTTNLTAASYTTTYLSNSEDALRTACSQLLVRIFLERATRRRQQVYYIVGLKLIVDATVQQSLAESKGNGGGLQAPGGLIVTATTGIPIQMDEILDVGLEGHHVGATTRQVGYVAQGEHVFAVQYRKVRIERVLRTASGANREEEILKASKWKVYLSTTRGGGEEDEEGELWVDLRGSLDAEDMDDWGLERVELDDETLFFSSL